MQRETLAERGFRLNTYNQLYHRLQELAKNSGEARVRSGIAERPADIDLPLSVIALTATRFALVSAPVSPQISVSASLMARALLGAFLRRNRGEFRC